MICLMGISRRKDIGENIIIVRRAILALIEIVMKKGFFSFETIL